MNKVQQFLEAILPERTFTVTLYHPKKSDNYTVNVPKIDKVKAKTAKQAAELFLNKHFPGSALYDVKVAHPTKKDNVLYDNWTAGTDASGQKIYISTITL